MSAVGKSLLKGAKEALAYATSRKKLDEETLKRWREVEQGKAISHEVVVAWLKTWGTDAETDRPLCKEEVLKN